MPAETVFADLHTHSTCSDGVLSPAEIVDRAAQAGLGAIAVTDHDTAAGALAACTAAPAGLLVVPGIEISTAHDGRPVHMLAYFCEGKSAGLAQVFEASARSRAERALAVAESLEADGYPVHPDELATCGKNVNRSLVARALVAAGAVPDVDTVFDTLIGLGCPYYVDRSDIDSVEAMRLVREAGGFPFIAHPGAYQVVDLVPTLAKEGLAGLEVFYPLHDAATRRQLVSMAGELGLAVSGGSDWHGDATHGSSLAAAGLDEEGFAAFLRACGRDADGRA